MIVLILLLVFGCFVIGLFYQLPKEILQIYKNFFPKLLSRVLFASLALTTFIFGIHSDVFSSYDKYIGDLENQYNWFSPREILKFPVEQYSINTKDVYPENVIDFSDGLIDELPTRKITILLDKTGSIKENANDIKKAELKRKLIKGLNNKLDFNENLDFDKVNIQDLFLLTAVERFTRPQKNDTITHVQVLIYTGSEVLNNGEISHNIIKGCGKTFKNRADREINRQNIINQCVDYIIKFNSDEEREKINRRYTDFYGIATKLKEDKYLGNVVSGIDFNHTSLILLSDFLHQSKESNNNLKDVEKAWFGVGNMISQINLILFEGNNQGLSDNPTPQNTIDILKKNLNHLYYFQFNQYVKNKEKPEDEIITMFATAVDGKKPKPLIVYHSWNRQEYRYDYKGQFSLNKENDNNIMVSFSNRIKPSGLIKPYNYAIFIRKNKHGRSTSNAIKIYENHKEILPAIGDDKYEVLFLVDEIESKNYFIEFTYPNKSYTVRHPIVFKPVLPKTSCLYLFALYFLFLLSLIHFCIYIFHLTFSNRNDTRRVFTFFWLSILSFAFLTIPLIFYFGENLVSLINNNTDLWWLMLLMAISILLSSILHFKSLMLFREKKKLKEDSFNKKNEKRKIVKENNLELKKILEDIQNSCAQKNLN